MALACGKLVFLMVLTLVGTLVGAADPDPLQDFCIADLSQKAFMNGYPCQDPATAKAEDFIFNGLKNASIITSDNPWGASANLAFARHWPALNTLGVSLVRLDLIPGASLRHTLTTWPPRWYLSHPESCTSDSWPTATMSMLPTSCSLGWSRQERCSSSPEAWCTSR
ncbi:hypothetical protein Mapa_016630 [Marchantia paleacea]|nr:hypothetical protein Mapa_016630 [Marchantia paleacea]